MSSSVIHYASTHLPTSFGIVDFHVYKEGHLEHVALCKGDIGQSEDILCRIHSECLTGEVFHSLKCDCKAQLDCALEKIAQAPCGILIYLRQEGRGIGLGNKIRAYALQEKGLDTVQSNRELGLPDDNRNYHAAIEILKHLKAKSIILATNNPKKLEALQKSPILVKRESHYINQLGQEAQHYIQTKRLKMGHLQK